MHRGIRLARFAVFAPRLASHNWLRLLSTNSSEIVVRVPALAESIKEATVAKIFKAKGAPVNRDEALAILDTEKVSIDINAPTGGIVLKVWRNVDEAVKAGDELFTIGEKEGVVNQSSKVKQELEQPREPSSSPSPPPLDKVKAAASVLSQTLSAVHNIASGYRKPLIQFRHGAGRIADALTPASLRAAVMGPGLKERVSHDDSLSTETLPAKYRRRQMSQEEIQIIELGGAQ
jgi:2-oxoglutarate dehydrogenase E2 component (dihydrolipoamide succinyltransferase)